MIGDRLSETRKFYNDTQAMLAKRLKVSVSTVRSWEQEKSSPPHEMLVSICRMYHVSADYLLGLSNVAPEMVEHSRLELLSPEELEELQSFERYLLWKRKKTAL